MPTAILQILASVLGLVAAWAITKFFLIPWFQKYQTWSDTKDNEKAIADSKKQEENLNREQERNQSREEDDFKRLEDELLKPKEPSK